MKCECCNTRAAAVTYEVKRARVVDTYRLCRTCHGDAVGVPYRVEAPALGLPPCLACGGPGGVCAGLCQPCLQKLRAAVKHHRAGGVVGPHSGGGVAALAVVLESAQNWRIYGDLIHLRCVLRGRLAADAAK